MPRPALVLFFLGVAAIAAVVVLLRPGSASQDGRSRWAWLSNWRLSGQTDERRPLNERPQNEKPLRERPYYHKRAMVPAGYFGFDSALVPDPPGVDSTHLDFAERALLIRDPIVIDSTEFRFEPNDHNPPTGSWDFPNVMVKAFQTKNGAANSSTVKSALQAWVSNGKVDLARLGGVWPQPQDVARFPVRLLAIVNRLDLARFSANGCNGSDAATAVSYAEFRFIYAGLSNFEMIVEFSFPAMSCDSFLGLAQTWNNLGALPIDSNFPGALKRALDGLTPAPTSARIRTLGALENIGRPSTWVFGQYTLDGTNITLNYLDQQFGKNPCASATNVGYFKAFIPNAGVAAVIASGATVYRFQGTQLATRNATLLGTPTTGTVFPLDTTWFPLVTHLDDVRYAISVSSCTGCHGWETVKTTHLDSTNNSSFNQVHYRDQGAKSPLSSFLAGTTGGTETHTPSLDPWPMNTTPSCGSTATGPRLFNDLLRRHLFMWTVLNTPKAQWPTNLLPYMTSEVH